MNLFAYCGNNPVNRIDPTGEAWWHWAIGAAIVAACAIATVATCGGFAAAASAVMLVAGGTAAASTSATVAAAAFIGSSVAFGMSAFIAADTSSSVEEFYDKGNWGTVAATAGGAIFGAGYGYDVSNSLNYTDTSNDANTAKHTQGMGSPKNNVNPNGSYTKLDNNGKIYSYTQFDSKGRQAMRIDFQGRPHAGVLPHIHVYNYLERGGRIEYVYDLYWNRIN